MNKIFLLPLFCTLLLLTSCERTSDFVTHAEAEIKPTKDSTVSGKVTFTSQPDGIKIVANITGLTPGVHGFHIHEFGNCSAPDASSAGGHFNPHKELHASPDSPHRHVGDLGNLTADERGNAHYERIDKVITLTGANSIIGKSVIVHADKDDFTTQPTGNAGGRLSCGVIKAVK